MMKNLKTALIFLLVLYTGNGLCAQQWSNPEAAQLYNQARQFLSNGNLKAAIPLYQQAIAIAPDQLVLYKDLANAWYLSGRYEEADKVIMPVIESGRGDEGCYQIAVANKIAQADDKKAGKLLAKGIEKFPHSGLLFHEWGKRYDDKNDEPAALAKWLEGIAADPAYRLNYYEAARTYMLTNKPVWALLYGEIFVNLEPVTPRSYETRKLIIAAYKRIFASVSAPAFGKSNGGRPESFEAAVVTTLQQLAPVVSDGFNAENLTMLRARFMIDWQAKYAARYPFSLFSFQEELLRNGQFDAYNQFLFGKVDNATQFEGWTKFHPNAIPGLEQYTASHPLRLTAGDAYNDGRMKDLFPKNPYKR